LDKSLINKRFGIIHPRNEQGVIFLFGACHKSCGFEAVTFGNCCPDATAYSKMVSRRIKIEFEYLSGNFILHKHELKDADLIICWRHDCYTLKIPVLELFSEKIFAQKNETEIYSIDFIKENKEIIRKVFKFEETKID
jgi:hypothetical protein